MKKLIEVVALHYLLEHAVHEVPPADFFQAASVYLRIQQFYFFVRHLAAHSLLDHVTELLLGQTSVCAAPGGQEELMSLLQAHEVDVTETFSVG